MLSFGAYDFSLGNVSTAKALVASAMSLLAELERRATHVSIFRIIILRTLVAMIYNEWNEPYRDVSANFQASQSLLEASDWRDKEQAFRYDSVLTGFFTKNLLDPGESDEALQVVDDIAERCRTQGYGLAAIYTTCTPRFRILFEMGMYTEVGSEGEELIKEWEKLLPSIDSLPVKLTYGLTSLRGLTGAVCANLGKLGKAEDYIHYALIEWENKFGPSGIDTLAYARNYITNLKHAHWTGSSDTESTIKTTQDKGSLSVGGKDEEAISADDQDEESISMESLIEKRIGPHKCWEFVLDVVRVAVRGTLLHDRMSEQVRLRPQQGSRLKYEVCY